MDKLAEGASPSEGTLSPCSLGELAAGDASYQAGRNARESTTRGLSEGSLRHFLYFSPSPDDRSGFDSSLAFACDGLPLRHEDVPRTRGR